MKREEYEKAIDGFVEIIRLLEATDERRTLTGEFVNVFRLWNEFSGITEPIHSKILAFLLSSNSMHGQGNLFLNLFLKRIGIESHIEDEWIVTAEKGRVDVLLKRYHPRSVVIIENKSNWAGDQPNQLYRYWYQNIHCVDEDCKNDYYLRHPEYKIVYLIPDEGKTLSDDSLSKPSDYPIDLPDILPIAPINMDFKHDIVDWLAECILSLPTENTPLKNLITQYKQYCKCL